MGDKELLKYFSLFPETKYAWLFELIVLGLCLFIMTLPMNYYGMFFVLGCMSWLIISLTRTFNDIWRKKIVKV